MKVSSQDNMRSFIVIMLVGVTGCAALDALHREEMFVDIEHGGTNAGAPAPNDPNLISIELCHWTQTPLFGPDGFGGRKRQVLYWITADRSATVCINPVLHENGAGLAGPITTTGKVVIDRKGKTVTFSLKPTPAASKRGRWEGIRATYQLRLER